MSEAPVNVAEPSVCPEPAADELLLRRFLAAYWLRPENALWMALRSTALRAVGVRSPALDLACGDGLFSFLHAGGALDERFDVFRAVGNLDRVTTMHADMFDVDPRGYQPPITQRPAWRYDVGSDLKAALLRKAAALRFYGQVVQHDANQPLPFPDRSFATVYCNSAYWVSEIDTFLAELRRIVRPDGNVLLHVKLDTIEQCTLDPLRSTLGDQFLHIIDRGRRGCWPALGSRATWERRFSRAGLGVVSVTQLAARTHAHLWDVGLRPIAPLLVRMANGLPTADRWAIKRDWLDLLMRLLKPLFRPDLDLLERGAHPVELQYVLRPSE